MNKNLDALRAAGWFACVVTLLVPALLAVATRELVKWVTLPIRYSTAWVLREFVLSTMAALDLRREDLDGECQSLLKEVDDVLKAESWR